MTVFQDVQHERGRFSRHQLGRRHSSCRVRTLAFRLQPKASRELETDDRMFNQTVQVQGGSDLVQLDRSAVCSSPVLRTSSAF